ncbi:MAG: hypothetical protein ABI142_07945 [Bryocella sp.]
MPSLDELIGSNPFANLEIPPQLEASIARHRQHLGELVHTMKTAGISHEQIEESVSVLIESYKAELLTAIRSMTR